MSLCRILIVRYSRFCPRTSRDSFFTTVPAPWCGYTTLSPTLYKPDLPFSSNSRQNADGLILRRRPRQYSENGLKRRLFPGIFGLWTEKPLLRPKIEPCADRLDEGLRFEQPGFPRLRPGRDDDLGETELGALLQTAFRLRRRPQASGQADLAEGGCRRANGRVLRRRGDRQRYREIRAGLVDPDAAGDVDEDVGLPEGDPRVTGKDGDDHREAFRV